MTIIVRDYLGDHRFLSEEELRHYTAAQPVASAQLIWATYRQAANEARISREGEGQANSPLASGSDIYVAVVE